MFCDDAGMPTGFVATVLDEETSTTSNYYRDESLSPTLTPPAGTPCRDTEFILSDVCYRAQSAGVGYAAGDTLTHSWIVEGSDLTTPVLEAWRNNSEATTVFLERPPDAPVGTVPTIADLVACSEVVHTELLKQCRCDLLAGGAIVQFVNAYLQMVDAGGNVTVEFIGRFTDSTLTVPYALSGTESDCADLGDQITGVTVRRERIIAAGTWTLTSMLATEISVRVDAIGNPLTPPALTDGGGTVTPLQLGQPEKWEGHGRVIRQPLEITTFAGDVLVITYTELTTT